MSAEFVLPVQTSVMPSLRPERDDRLESSGAARGNPAGTQPGPDQQDRDERERRQIATGRAGQLRREVREIMRRQHSQRRVPSIIVQPPCASRSNGSADPLPQGDPYTHFPDTLRRGVRRHGVQSDRPERKCNRGEDDEHRSEHAPYRRFLRIASTSVLHEFVAIHCYS